MHQNVYDIFYDFNASIEGILRWMYLDANGSVRVGIGALIDSIPAALNLPFEYDEWPGVEATPEEIRTEWQLVKLRTDLALKGANAFWNLTRLRLSDDAIRTLTSENLLANEAYLKQLFPEFEYWPADAQLGLLSMAWVLGAGFPKLWPHFRQACLRQDWDAAAEHCQISQVGNLSVTPRNYANQMMFSCAARVVEFEKQYSYRRDIVYALTSTGSTSGVASEKGLLPLILNNQVQKDICSTYSVSGIN